MVFLVLLLFATQLAFDLYATSVASSAAHDAARRVAGYDAADRRAAAAQVETAELVRRLGAGGQREISVRWDLDAPDHVAVHIRAVHPSVLPSSWAGRTPLGTLERTITVHREER